MKTVKQLCHCSAFKLLCARMLVEFDMKRDYLYGIVKFSFALALLFRILYRISGLVIMRRDTFMLDEHGG